MSIFRQPLVFGFVYLLFLIYPRRENMASLSTKIKHLPLFENNIL